MESVTGRDDGRSGAAEDGEPPALRVVGLRKVFGEYPAVNGADLTVRPGSCYGLVGPNGAGKTTTPSMATGLLHLMRAGKTAAEERGGPRRCWRR